MARILIVEDELPIALGLEEDLRRQGHEAEIAADGEAGLRRGCGEPWDLILLDVMLPKLDGFEVCRELRRAAVRNPDADSVRSGGREGDGPGPGCRRLSDQAFRDS